MANCENIEPQQLLDLLRHDRERGTALLLETYTPLLWSVCQRRLSDPEDIKECVNDVFMEFCMNPERYDSQQSSLKNYLAMIADRRAISYYRSNQRRDQAESATGQNQKQLDAQIELHTQLEEALSQLQQEDAQIIRLKYYGGMTYGEIAKTMGITEDAAKKRGSRSLRKIAKWLIIGTIIAALLAGCAYVAHRYFRYSRSIGITWGEETHVYQMTAPPEAISAAGMTIHLLNASYSADSLSLTLAHFPAEGSEINGYHIAFDISVNGGDMMSCHSSTDMLGEYFIELPWDSLSPGEDGSLHLSLQLEMEEISIEKHFTAADLESINSHLHWDITLEEAASQESLTDLGYYLETSHANFLVMADQEVPENAQGDYTIISLYPIYTQEDYTLAGPLTTYYLLLDGIENEQITLTDGGGNSYPVFRIMSPSSSGVTEFALWFQDVPPGEYTLNIPRLVYEGAQQVTTLTLPAPQEDGISFPCDETVTFADGSAVHFTGITRQTERGTARYFLEVWENGVQNWVPIEDEESQWTYTLDYQVTTDPDFPLFGYKASADISYLTDSGYEVLARSSDMTAPSFRSKTILCALRDGLALPDPEGLTVTFVTPAYSDEQDYSIRITIR